MTEAPAPAIARLVAELGPHWDDLTLILQVHAAHWRLHLRDGTVITLTHEPQRDALVACTRQSRGDPANHLAIATALLGLNALHTETGGLRLGLTEEGEIELVLAIADDVDSVDDVQQMLQHLAVFTRQWRAFVAQPTGTMPVPPEHALRV